MPVRNSKLIAFGTKSLTISPSEITLDYIKQYQPYSIIEYGGVDYLCVNSNTEDMMISLQRRDTIYESSVITDCRYSEKIEKVIYIPAHSYIDITGKLHYVEIDKGKLQ